MPSFRGVPEQIAREARNWGENAGKQYDEGFEKHAVASAKKAGDKASKELEDSGAKSGDRAGKAYAGRFETAVKQAVQRASREVGTIKIDADDQAAQRKLQTLKRGLEALDKSKIGVDIDGAGAFAKLTAIEEGLREIQDRASTIDARVNAAGALSEVAKIRSELMALSAIQIEPELKIDRQMGAFERGLKGAIESALRDIGPVNVGPGSDAGQRALGDLRRQLHELGDLRIGIDISDETARERLAQIRDQLEQLQREHWSVSMDADTAAAEANLAAFLAVLDRIDGRHVDVKVDVKDAVLSTRLLGELEKQGLLASNSVDRLGGSVRHASTSGQDGANSFRAFNARVLGITALGPAVVPALGAIAGGIGALLPLAAAGGVAVGVLVAGLISVGQAYKAMIAMQQSADRDAETYSKAADNASRQVRDAQQGLVQAREQAARSAEDSARRVADAQRSVVDAERGVADAERNLRDAQEAAQQAQEGLTRARKEAADQLDELQLRVRGNALDQRQATLDLHQAEKDLADARTKGLQGDDLERYLLAYDRAKLRIDQVKEDQSQLNAEQQKWAKTGIEGSDVVVAAQQRVQQANRGVLDAARGVADAQQRVADAERGVADARREQARSAEDSARAVSAAQQQVNDALDNYSMALGKSSAAQDKFNQQMAQLSPTGRAFVKFLDNLRPRLQLISQISQEGFLPGLSAWIGAITDHDGPKLLSVVKGISGALGDMFARFATSLQGPEFGQFFDMLDRAGPRFIGYMGAVLDNLGTGVASLTAAMEPLADLFGTWLLEGSRTFRNWAASLSGSTGLQNFFDYVRKIGPEIKDFFQELWRALVAVGKALAPFGERGLGYLTDALAFIADMDPKKLEFIATNIIKVVLALQAIFALTASAKSFQSAIHIVDDVLSKIGSRAPGLAAVGGQVGMFGLAFGVLYSQSSLVRDAVNDVLKAFVDLGNWIIGHIGGIKELATTIALVAASWKAASMLGGWTKALGTVAGEAAGSWGRMAYQMSGSVDTGVRVTKTMSGVSKVLGAVGNALPIIGIGFGLMAAGMEAANQRTQEQNDRLYGWIEATHQGGAKAQDAAKKLAEYRQKIKDTESGLADMEAQTHTVYGAQEGFAQAIAITSDEIKKQKKALEGQQKKYDEWWASLTPIEQAQATLAAAQNDLTTAVRDHGKYSHEAAVASDAYSAAQERLKQLQYDVAAATSGLNQELLDQLGIMETLADAELGYEQAVSSLEDAHKRSADTLKQYGANSKEYKDALLAEERAEKSTAEAAQRTMEARYSNADATTRQAMGQAAYYLELERQKKIYGELPPRLEEIRSTMESTLDPTTIAAARFYDLGVKIDKVPDNKTIILDSSTTDVAIQKMQDLGLHVERLPDGTVKVDALTDDAKKIIDELLKPRTLDVTVQVWDPSGQMYKSHENTDKNWGPGGQAAAPGFATGGPIRGWGSWTSDNIPIWASPGEYIVRAASVAKYGLPLLDAINTGTFGERFARGGRVQPHTKGGLFAYADGGPVASWGGTIQINGGNLNPLAGLWFNALNQIQQMAGQASGLITGAFLGMRDTAMRIFGQLTTGVLGQWFPFLGQLQNSTGGTRDGVLGILGNLRDNAVSTIFDAVQRMLRQWISLPGGLLNPVNTIIDKVLNNGLFRAFNAIVSALGLDAKLNIPVQAPAKLAAGGKVPGWSPHDKADNIPAMLTAGEYVQPVDVVDYYGPDFMEAIRQKKIPRGVLGYATGGWVAMQNVIKTQFPWARITSAYRPGANDYHGAGKAIDIAGASPWPNPLAIQQMLEINRWIASNFSNITELIHTGAGAINLWHGQPHTYSPLIQAQHMNHVHWAMANGLTPGSSLLGALGNLLGVGVDLISDPAGFLKNVVDGALSGFDSDGTPVKRIMAEGARKVTGWMADKVTSLLGSVFGAGDSGYTGPGGGPVVDQVRAVFSQFGWDKGPMWDAASWIIQHESGWNPYAKNPSSTASGLFQLLDGTWASTGVGKTWDVGLQALAGARYIRNRYGNPVNAKAFWQAHHWYADGGPVQDTDPGTGAVIPDLHDTGGWLMPGLNVIMNRTGRPEPTINPQTLDALLTIADGGGTGAPMIGQLNLPLMNSPTPEDIASEIMHNVTVARRGGKF